jgi:cytochrome P450
LPFDGGPRICVGQRFVLTEAGYATFRLMQTFTGTEDRSGREWGAKQHLTVSLWGTKVALMRA